MVLMSQTSPSHIRTEILQCKNGTNALYNRSNNTNASRTSTVAFPRDPFKTTQSMHVNAIGAKSKRGNQVIVAASPPTEDAMLATEPLTKEDLVAYLASGCKPKENWRFNLYFYCSFVINCIICIIYHVYVITHACSMIGRTLLIWQNRN